MIKKTVAGLAVAVVIAVTGCGNQDQGINKPEQAVDQYIEAASNLDWGELDNLLSGEALVDAKKNMGRYTMPDRVISKKLELHPITEGIVEVSADISRETGHGVDRVAYRFTLNNQEGNWKIYQCEYGDYLHGQLKPGSLPVGADQVVREYIELSPKQKNEKAVNYLAGRLLKVAAAQNHTPVPPDNEVRQAVKKIICMGSSEDYTVVQADYDITREDKVIPASAVIDLVSVDGKWRIVKLGISKI